MPGATIRFAQSGRESSAIGLTVAQGLLLTLTDSSAERSHREQARRTAIGLLKLDESLDMVSTARAVAKIIEEVPAPTGGSLRSGPASPENSPTATGTALPKKEKGQGRGGKAVKDKKQSSGNSGYQESMHPRGRGGVWIKKGDGMGQGQQPNPQVAQMQRRLQELGYGPGAADGQYGNLTAGALAKFQADHGLQGGGQNLDPATLQTLQNPPPEKIGQIQAQNAQIAALPNAQGQLPHTAAGGGGGAAGGTGAAGVGTAGVAGGGTTAGAPGRAPAATSSAGSTTLNTNDPQAVRQFQQAHGLQVDGIVGPQTQGEMNKLNVSSPAGPKTTHNADGTTTTLSGPGTPTAPSAPRARASTKSTSTKSSANLQKGTGIAGNASPKVKTVQTQLQDLGYNLGVSGVDGRFGPDTEKAVKKLQRKYGLKADGVVGPQTSKLVARLTKRLSKNTKGLDAASSPLLAPGPKTMHQAVVEATELRVRAQESGDVGAFIEARTREVQARAQLEEFLGRGGSTVHFDPSLHPRNRHGQFREILNGLAVGDKASLPTGITVHRTESGFEVHGGTKSEKAKKGFSNVSAAADEAIARLDVRSISSGHTPVGRDDTVKMVKAQTKRDTGTGKRTRRKGSFVSWLEGNPLSESLLIEAFNDAAELRIGDHDVSGFTAARAAEVELARRICEGGALSSEARKASATVVRTGPGGKKDYKFPIPDKNHARAALAYLDSSDLSDAEKTKVRAKAKRTIAEERLIDSLSTEDAVLVALIAEAKCGMPHSAMSKRGKTKCPGCGADIGKLAKTMEEAADSLAKASTPEPWSTSKTSNWVARGGGLPAYIQHISHDLHEKRGMDESKAIGMAVGIVKRWCRGGGKVDANTKAAACKAVKEWNELRAKAHGG